MQKVEGNIYLETFTGKRDLEKTIGDSSPSPGQTSKGRYILT